MKRQTMRSLVDLVSGLNIVQLSEARHKTLCEQHNLDPGSTYGFYDYKSTVSFRKCFVL